MAQSKLQTMRQLSYFVIFLLILSACRPSTEMFNSTYDPATNESNLTEAFKTIPIRIRPGDKITLSIFGHDEWSVGSINTIYNAGEATGRYLVVDPDGEVNLPRVGRITIAGLSVKEVNYFLEQHYSEIIKNPTINVRVLNHYVTIMGEVNSPGRFPLDHQETTILDLLGMAHGLTAYADQRNIKIIRTIESESVELFVDLSELNTAEQYNVTLRPDDIVFINSNKRQAEEDFFRVATPIAGIATAIAILLTTFVK